MQAYNIGIILVMIKLIQYLIETLFDMEFPPIVSIILLGLFGSGITLIIIDLLATGVTLWLSVPIVITILICMACLVRIELKNLINHKNKDEQAYIKYIRKKCNQMKKIIFTILIVILLAFIVHWIGIPIGTYIDMGLDWVFKWTSGIIPKLTELLPKWGEWVRQTVSGWTASL